MYLNLATRLPAAASSAPADSGGGGDTAAPAGGACKTGLPPSKRKREDQQGTPAPPQQPAAPEGRAAKLPGSFPQAAGPRRPPREAVAAQMSEEDIDWSGGPCCGDGEQPQAPCPVLPAGATVAEAGAPCLGSAKSAVAKAAAAEGVGAGATSEAADSCAEAEGAEVPASAAAAAAAAVIEGGQAWCGAECAGNRGGGGGEPEPGTADQTSSDWAEEAHAAVVQKVRKFVMAILDPLYAATVIDGRVRVLPRGSGLWSDPSAPWAEMGPCTRLASLMDI